jgi:hypothetical protein
LIKNKGLEEHQKGGELDQVFVKLSKEGNMKKTGEMPG